MEAEEGGGGVLVVVDDSLYPFFEGGGSEVDQEAEGHFQKAEVSEELFGMDRGQDFDRFELNHETVFHDMSARKPSSNSKPISCIGMGTWRRTERPRSSSMRAKTSS